MEGDVSESTPLPTPPLVAQAVRFCRSCGRAWELAWLECPFCADSGASTAVIEQANANFARDKSAVGSAIALYFSLLCVSITLMIYLNASGQVHGSALAMMVATTCISIIAAVGSIASARQVIPLLRKPPPIRVALLAPVLAIGTYLIAHLSVSALHNLLKVPTYGYLDPFFSAGYGMTAAIVTICVQPAIFEELAFRGVILTSLEPVVSQREALLVSALLFAILHLSIPSLPHLFIMGMVLGWLRQRTGSLWPGIILHFTHNLLALLVELLWSSSLW